MSQQVDGTAEGKHDSLTQTPPTSVPAPRHAETQSWSSQPGSATTADASAEHAQPPAGYAQPPAGYAQPPAGYTYPPAGYAQPDPYAQAPAGYAQPPAGYAYPPANYAQQPTGYAQAPAGYPQSPAGYAQPNPYAQPPAGYSQPPAGYANPPAGYPHADAYAQAAGYAQPPTGYPQPEAGYAQPQQVAYAAAPVATPAPQPRPAVPLQDFKVDLPHIDTPRPQSNTPFSRILRVEFKKMLDTRAARWVLISGALLQIIGAGIFFAVAKEPASFAASVKASQGLWTIFLSIVLALLVCQEWSKRAGLVTFALVPQRNRVLAAKALGGGAFCLVAVAAQMGFMALVHWLSALKTDKGVNFSVDEGFWWTTAINVVFTLALAFGLSLIFRHPAPAIVAPLVLTLIVSSTLLMFDATRKTAEWLFASPIMMKWTMGSGADRTTVITATDWWQLAVATTWQVILPTVIGIVLVRRAEIK